MKVESKFKELVRKEAVVRLEDDFYDMLEYKSAVSRFWITHCMFLIEKMKEEGKFDFGHYITLKHYIEQAKKAILLP